MRNEAVVTYSDHLPSVIPNTVRAQGENDIKTLSKLSRSTRPRRRSPDRRFRSTRTRSQVQQARTLQELFLTSRERFIRIAYRILRNREDAEDAVQDAFLSACRHLREFEGRSALTTWFTRIVMNAALMLRRKRKNAARLGSHETDAAMSLLTEVVPDTKPNPELAYSRAEAFEILEVHLKELNPLLREAVAMTYYDELSITEASSALGVTPGTIKARLFRGRRLLQQRATL
jgi:RNA polymerase sigma factor (sigma-70 family)